MTFAPVAASREAADRGPLPSFTGESGSREPAKRGAGDCSVRIFLDAARVTRRGLTVEGCAQENPPLPEVADMDDADVRQGVDRVVEQWWGTIVATPECGEPAKQDLKDRLVRCVMGFLAHAENGARGQERAA